MTTPAPIYSSDGLECFAMFPDNTRLQPQTLDFPTYGTTSPAGDRQLRAMTDSGTTIPLSFTTTTPADLQYLRDFFERKLGMYLPFLVPTFEDDFDTLQNVPDIGITVDGLVCDSMVDCEIWVAFIDNNQVIDVAPTTLIQYAGAYLLQDIQLPTPTTRLSLCFKVRFDSDTFKYVPNLHVQTINLAFVEVA